MLPHSITHYIRHIVRCHSLFVSSSFCFEMNMKIENPASWEIRSVFKFLNAKNVRPAEIYRQVWEVYGEDGVRCSVKGRRTSTWWSKWPSVLKSLPTCLSRWMRRFEKREDSPFSLLKEIFSGRTIQQRWWCENSRVAFGQKVEGKFLRRQDTKTCAPIWQMSQLGWRLCREVANSM
jgi:hypothetical protein